MNSLGIIILNWNGHQDTVEAISSIRNNEEQYFTIFLLDNGSKEDSVEYILNWLEESYELSYKIMNEDEFLNCKDFSNYTLYFIRGKHNLGFAKGNNFIWNKIKNMFDYTLLLNNDTIITKNAISNMINYMNKNKNVGVISCEIRFYNQPDRLWSAGGYFIWYGDRKYYKQKKIDTFKKKGIEVIKTPFVTGCVLMVRNVIADIYGLFTEKFFFGEEDFNYCKRLWQNGVVVETLLSSVIYHKVGNSIKKAQKSVNNYILHFSNRIIDLKDFYSPLKWKLWRVFYITAVFFKVAIMVKGIKTSAKVVKHIYQYSSILNNISYDTFLEINSL